jgi:hypothetical protein
VPGLEQAVDQTAIWALDRDRQISRVAEARKPPDEPVEAVAAVRDGVTPSLRAVIAVNRDRVVRGSPVDPCEHRFSYPVLRGGKTVFGGSDAAVSEASRVVTDRRSTARPSVADVASVQVGGGGVVLALEGRP